MNLNTSVFHRLACTAALLLAVALAMPVAAQAAPGDGLEDQNTAATQRRKKTDPPEPAPLPPEVLERLDRMQAEIDALKAAKEDADLKVDELTVTMAEQKKEQKRKDEKEKKEKAGTSFKGWYAASLSSQFGGDNPVNFAFNEVELDVDAAAADWVSFKADLQVRPEFSDPEEQKANSGPDLNHMESELSGPGVVDHIAEQGYARFMLHKAKKLVITTGKFNSDLGMEPFDAVDTEFLSHSMTHLHGIARSLTGARIGFNPTDAVRLEAFAAQGWNVDKDGNKTPSLGAQLRVNLPGTMDASMAAYYGEDSETLDLPDGSTSVQTEVPRLTANAHARITAVKNWKLGLEVAFGQETVQKDNNSGGTDDVTARWLSSYLTADYNPIPWLTVAARGEFFSDDKGVRLPRLKFENGGYMYGAYLASKLTLTDTVFLIGECSYKGSDLEVLTGPDGDRSKYELFVGAQLYFLFGESNNDAVHSLADTLGSD